MTLPANHPGRVTLNDEVHARPPEPVRAPARLSYIAMLCDADAREASHHAVAALARTCGVTPPAPGDNHFSADLLAFHLKWERHTEFVRYSFIRADTPSQPIDPRDPFAENALDAVPAHWIAGLPGTVIMAAHLVLLPGGADDDPAALGTRIFPRDVPVGSLLNDREAAVFTDFRIYPDGFSRILVQDLGMTAWQTGRVIQRLLEIDTYRMMALLALPVAQTLAPVISRCEQELARITAALVTAGEAEEPGLLDRLTRLAAEIDSRQADNLYRFGAAAAYDEIVQRRIAELRERRLPGLQTLQEFIERRMAPAMNTCRSVAARQEELSRRVARATQLLSTRIGITREGQSNALLATMNRRVRQQVRLQSTVEGLSVAAVTYYVVGLIGFLAEGLAAANALPLRPYVVKGLSVPVVALILLLALRRMRRHLTRDG